MYECADNSESEGTYKSMDQLKCAGEWVEHRSCTEIVCSVPRQQLAVSGAVPRGSGSRAGRRSGRGGGAALSAAGHTQALSTVQLHIYTPGQAAAPRQPLLPPLQPWQVSTQSILQIYTGV